MPLAPQLGHALALWAYNLTQPSARSDFSATVEELHFTTLAPGGWGDLTCKLHVKDARAYAQRLELALFANVAVMDGTFAVFQGRWDEPGIVLDESDGDTVELTAQGAANCTQDDPQDTSYNGSTAMAIISDQMTSSTLKRNKSLPLDPDQGQVLPNAPGQTFYKAFDGKSFEDVLNELMPELGDYTWAVWNHALNRDAAGFPTWQMYVHQRVTTTITPAYTGYITGEVSNEIRPSVEYAYNVVTLKYRDATTSLPTFVTVTDSRLNSNGSQGTAPFPWRRISKDLTTQLISASQATTIANAYLAEYQNGGSKITVVLGEVRDANGSPIPLWQVRADNYINLPDLAPAGAVLPTAQTAYTWAQGGTLFYIQETAYDESQGQEPRLTLTCDSFRDTADFQVQRLQIAMEAIRLKSRKTHSPVQASGEQLNGSFAWTDNPTANNVVFLRQVQFGVTASAAPSSVTLSVSTSTNATGITAGDYTQNGFSISWTVPSSASASTIKGTWKTVGI